MNKFKKYKYTFKFKNKIKLNNENYLINKISFNSDRNINSSHNFLIPKVIYNNIETQKVLILKDNKGKSGIYRLTNLINSKTYIGSAIDLTTRF